MTGLLRLSATLLATLGLLVGGIAQAGQTPPPAPAPPDPLVYDASDGTKQAIGVAKWGYALDDAFYGMNDTRAAVAAYGL